MAFKTIKVPSNGEKITMGSDGKLARAGAADHSLHRGRRNRAGHLARLAVRVRQRGQEGLRRQAQDRLDGSLRGREIVQPVQQLAARRNRRGVQGIPGRNQGAADDAGRRRHPLAQRRAAPDARSLRLPAPGALLQGRAEPGEKSREGRHGHLPREHRRHLCRHRMGGRIARSEKGHQVPARGDEGHQDSFPQHLGHRHQAGLARGLRAAHPRGDQLRHRAQAQERHPGAQGQHHEVHRGRLPRLGLRAHASASSRAARSDGTTATASRPRGKSWSRTTSPTSRCSRC